MERKTTADFDPEVLVLFDAYVHGHVDRRGFLDKASRFAVGGVTAAMLLDPARCIRCGLCAERCPTGAITMEQFHFEERPICRAG